MNITKQQITDFILDMVNRRGLPPAGKVATMETRGGLVAFGREAGGKLFAAREWYVPESYGDDDLSSTGYRLPPRMGSTRKSKEVSDDTLQALSLRLGELEG